MRRDVRWRASPPGLRLVRFRSIPLPPAYFHRFAILTHNPIAVFADRSKTRRSLHPPTHTRVVANTFRAFVPKDSAGRFLSSLGFRLSVAGCEPPSEKRRENLSRGSSSRRWVPRRENGRRLLFVQEAEISEIRSLFTFESEEPRGFGNRYGLRGKMYR